VTTGHLIADLELALDGDVHLDQLNDTGRQLVALLVPLDLGGVAFADLVFLFANLIDQVPDTFFKVLAIFDGDALILLKLQ
jgi:hypothetical protein